MRLKALVIGMAVVIVVGFVVVVATLVTRLSNPTRTEVLGEIAVPVPAGCLLADAWTADDRLYLRYAGADCGLVVAVDPESGQELARFHGKTQP